MKLSKERTGNIIVKAWTNSEWDSCNFAIIGISEDYLQALVLRSEAANKLSEMDRFVSMKFVDGHADYYILPEEDNEVLEDFRAGKEDWSYISITQEEIDELSKPEQYVDCGVSVFDKYGCVRYSACGKHTGEDFYTSEIVISQL